MNDTDDNDIGDHDTGGDGSGNAASLFRLFNEIAIIGQLSQTVLNRRLPEGLHVSHFGVLNHLVRLGDGRTPLSISDAFQVSKGTMTNTLAALASRGLVSMSPHPSDGRSKLVHLTEEGRAFHERAVIAVGEAMSRLDDLVDTETLLAIVPVLQTLRETLDRHRDL